jgi:hypothetical protein
VPCGCALCAIGHLSGRAPRPRGRHRRTVRAESLERRRRRAASP